MPDASLISPSGKDFETARLRAERIGPGHFDDLSRMHRDEQVMRWLGGVREEPETRAFLAREAGLWARDGFGLVMLYERAEGRHAGHGGLRWTKVQEDDVVELAYALMPEFQGRGLATEFARAALRVGFGPLALPEVAAFTMTTNRASRRVMEKCGFAYERDFERAGAPHALYRLRAPQ